MDPAAFAPSAQQALAASVFPPRPRTVKVLVVADSAMFRKTLSRWMLEQPELAPVGEANSVAAARASLGRQRPDLVLLEHNLGSESGLALLAELRAAHPPIPAIVMFAAEDAPAAPTFRQAGAQGLVAKPRICTELVRGVKEVMQGKSFACAHITRAIRKPAPAQSPGAVEAAVSPA